MSPRLVESSPLSIIIGLFMVFIGYQIWKIFRLNEIVLFKEAIRFKHSLVYLHMQRWLSSHSSHSPTTLYMNQKYLRVVKLAHRSGDSKAVVDRATKRPLGEVLDALRKLDETNLDEIKVKLLKFISDKKNESLACIRTRLDSVIWTDDLTHDSTRSDSVESSLFFPDSSQRLEKCQGMTWTKTR